MIWTELIALVLLCTGQRGVVFTNGTVIEAPVNTLALIGSDVQFTCRSDDPLSVIRWEQIMLPTRRPDTLPSLLPHQSSIVIFNGEKVTDNFQTRFSVTVVDNVSTLNVSSVNINDSLWFYACLETGRSWKYVSELSVLFFNDTSKLAVIHNSAGPIQLQYDTLNISCSDGGNFVNGDRSRCGVSSAAFQLLRSHVLRSKGIAYERDDVDYDCAINLVRTGDCQSQQQQQQRCLLAPVSCDSRRYFRCASNIPTIAARCPLNSSMLRGTSAHTSKAADTVLYRSTTSSAAHTEPASAATTGQETSNVVVWSVIGGVLALVLISLTAAAAVSTMIRKRHPTSQGRQRSTSDRQRPSSQDDLYDEIPDLPPSGTECSYSVDIGGVSHLSTSGNSEYARLKRPGGRLQQLIRTVTHS